MGAMVVEKCLRENRIRVFWEEDKIRRFIVSAPYQLEIEGLSYQFFSNGNHNVAYQSVDKRWVFKSLIDPVLDTTDSPERSVRLWNLINPRFPARVVYAGEKAIGWVAPFILGTKPANSEIVKKLFEIYEKTGRIVVDAFVTANFIKMADESVVCIDLDVALQLEKRLRRQSSQESLDFWYNNENFQTYYCAFADTVNELPGLISVVNATKALLYLQVHRPDFRYVSALCSNVQLINRLAAGYDENNKPDNRAQYPVQNISDLDAQLPQPFFVAPAAVSTSNDEGFSVVLSSPTLDGTVSVSDSRSSDGVQSQSGSAALSVGRERCDIAVSKTRFDIHFFAKQLAENKKPYNFIDCLANNTTASWLDQLGKAS